MLEKIISQVNAIVWNPALVVLLIAAGLYFSFRTRMVQVRRLGLMFRSLFGKKRGKDEGQVGTIFQRKILSGS